MALHDDFLGQAKGLARRRGRPSQINLRRATSAAYYALFHLLIAEAVNRMIPAQPSSLRARAARAFQHGEMKEVCVAFKAPSSPKKLIPLLGPAVSTELRSIAETFVDLQEERHAADYDISLVLSQSSALNSIANVESAFQAWGKIRATEEVNVFLAALILGRRWDR